jgi:mRNA interferase RelE/StbE
MLNIDLSKKTQEFLAKIPRKHAEQIIKKIDKLAEDPAAFKSKQLQGYPHFQRIKSGDYRIIYRIENAILMLYVVRVGMRNDGEVYKGLDELDVE